MLVKIANTREVKKKNAFSTRGLHCTLDNNRVDHNGITKKLSM